MCFCGIDFTVKFKILKVGSFFLLGCSVLVEKW